MIATNRFNMIVQAPLLEPLPHAANRFFNENARAATNIDFGVENARLCIMFELELGWRAFPGVFVGNN